MSDQVKREVVLIIPMYPNMELAAAQTASILAELMNFEENHIDEIQFAIIETCINAFEHSQSEDKRVFITFIMKDDALELKITDRGVGFRLEPSKPSPIEEVMDGSMKKRGWGLEIIQSMMDEVSVESSEQGTTITMIKKKMLPQQAGGV